MSSSTFSSSNMDQGRDDCKTRMARGHCNPVVVPQAVLAAASVISLGCSAYLLHHTSSAVAIVGILTAVLTLSYRILFQVATRSSVKQSHTSQLISALKLVSTHERIAMVILTAAWVFTFIFEIVIDSSLDKPIWRSSHLRAVEIVRLLAAAFALMAAVGICILVHLRQRATEELPYDTEKRPYPVFRSTPKVFRSHSASLLSAKPSLASISSSIPSSSSSNNSSIHKSPCKPTYTPFLPTTRICDSPISSLPPHPKLKRVSSTPSLPPIPILPPIPTPVPARLAPSSVPTSSTSRPQKRSHPELRRKRSIKSISSTSSRSQELRKVTSPLTEEAATFPGANMASVRRAKSHRSSSSGSTHKSRLRIMETVSEPMHGEEESSASENDIPAVPPLDTSRWTHVQGVSKRHSRPKAESKVYSCRTEAAPIQSRAPHTSRHASRDTAQAFKNRPLPPLPLMVVKKIRVGGAQHTTPSPQRAQSRVSKAASLVRSKSAATARSVASAGIKKGHKVQRSQYARSIALQGGESDLDHHDDSQAVPTPVPGLTEAERQRLALKLVLEDRSLWRRSTLEGIRGVGV